MVEVPPDTVLSRTTLTITVKHKSLVVGSVAVHLGVLGWLETTYSPGSSGFAMTFQYLSPPSKSADPAYLGARTQLVVKGLNAVFF